MIDISKSLQKRPCFFMAIMFSAGIFLFSTSLIRLDFRSVSMAAYISILLSCIFIKKSFLFNIFVLVTIFFIGGCFYANYNKIYRQGLLSIGNKSEGLIGTIISPRIKRSIRYGKVNSIYLFSPEMVKDKEAWLKTRGKCFLSIQTERTYNYGDRILLKRFRLFEGRADRRIIVNARWQDAIFLSPAYRINPVFKIVYSIRKKISNFIRKSFAFRNGAFLQAVLLGERSDINRQMEKGFKESGTMHLLAISGLHVGIISIIVLSFLRFLRIRREVSYAIVILFIVFFSMLALSRPPVVRAGVMTSFFLIGLLLGRRPDPYNTLGVSAIFLLIRNPLEVHNPGFQLSFIAVFFILFLAPIFIRILSSVTDNRYIKKFLWLPFSVSFSAWLGTSLPIAYYFKIITPVAIVANIFLIPLVFLQIISALLFLLLACVPFLGGAALLLSTYTGNMIFFLADFFASLKFGHFYI